MSIGPIRNFTKKSLFSTIGKTMSEINDQKMKLRADVAERLAKLSRGEKGRQNKIVLEKVLALPEFEQSKRVSIYLSTENEINTKPMVERIFQDGKQCFIPRYSKMGMEMVKLHSMEDWDKLPLTPWKIKQPKLKEEREDALDTGGLDLMIVPGVAFTKNGRRLGHGGGYYDRYIRNLRKTQKTPFVTVAVAFKEQVLDEIPTHDHDQMIDEILFVE